MPAQEERISMLEQTVTVLNRGIWDIYHHETILLGMAIKQEEDLREVKLKLADLSGHVHALDDHVLTLDNHLHTFEQGVNRRFEALEQRVSGLEGNIGTLEHNVEALDTRIGTLEHNVEALDGRIGSLELKVEALDGRIGSLEQTMNSRFEEQDKKFDQILLLLNRLIPTSNQD